MLPGLDEDVAPPAAGNIIWMPLVTGECVCEGMFLATYTSHWVSPHISSSTEVAPLSRCGVMKPSFHAHRAYMMFMRSQVTVLVV